MALKRAVPPSNTFSLWQAGWLPCKCSGVDGRVSKSAHTHTHSATELSSWVHRIGTCRVYITDWFQIGRVVIGGLVLWEQQSDTSFLNWPVHLSVCIYPSSYLPICCHFVGRENNWCGCWNFCQLGFIVAGSSYRTKGMVYGTQGWSVCLKASSFICQERKKESSPCDCMYTN